MIQWFQWTRLRTRTEQYFTVILSLPYRSVPVLNRSVPFPFHFPWSVTFRVCLALLEYNLTLNFCRTVIEKFGFKVRLRYGTYTVRIQVRWNYCILIHHHHTILEDWSRGFFFLNATKSWLQSDLFTPYFLSNLSCF